jgi:hypothetical protein
MVGNNRRNDLCKGFSVCPAILAHTTRRLSSSVSLSFLLGRLVFFSFVPLINPSEILNTKACISSPRISITSEPFFSPGKKMISHFPPSHPWTHVVIGMWHKYPNSKCTHVVSIDTIDRTVDPVTGIIRTERLMGCKQKAPIWIVKVRFSR